MLESFDRRARDLIDRLGAGEPVELVSSELDALRSDWRRLDGAERERLRETTAALARLTGASTRTSIRAAGNQAGGDGSGEQEEALLALRGLDRVSHHAPTRFYDGPPEPEALLEHFGLSRFRPGQREAVAAALAGRDALVIMPTGGGKSVCYLLPGLATPRLTIVVSPLIALMSQQYRRLAEAGHPAVMLASGLPKEHGRRAVAAIADGRARIVFCSPERFASTRFIELLARRQIALFAVDEAHCVSEWGHDFRPDYLRLEDVLLRLGQPPTLACTATATPAVAQEIRTRLHLRKPLIVHGGFDRPNLSFDVVRFEGRGASARRLQTLVAALRAPENRPSIVYAGTRSAVDSLSGELRGLGFDAVGYHAGLEPDERASAQLRFLTGDADIVVATNAFGMGIDKADVRSVIHYTIPTSIEAYYQEAGRAGRDGGPARALLLAMRSDLGRLIRFNQDPSRSLSEVARERGWAAYHAIERFTWTDQRCRRAQILEHFGDRRPPAPSGRCCDVCEAPDWLPSADEIASAAAAARGGRSRTRSSRTADAVTLSAADERLFEALVAWRREAADGKPAYTVAHNATLRAVAAGRPAAAQELLAISGIGPAFVERHADAVLAIVANAAEGSVS